MEQKSNMTNNKLAIGGKDILNNLGITIDWVLRVEKDPTQVNLPDDKFEHPQQAVMSVTQSITFIQDVKNTTDEIDKYVVDSLNEKLHDCLYWVCRVFNDPNMVKAETDSVDWPVETIKVLFDMRSFLRDCITSFGHDPYGEDF